LVSKVSNLINPFARVWDEELLRSLFWEINVNRYMEIPIAPHCMEDFVACHDTNMNFNIEIYISCQVGVQIWSKERRTLE
jgi:hypothetical protein